MKTLEKDTILTNMKTKADWEILCDTCADLAEKANWTKKDSDKLIKDVRKELR